VYCLPSEPQCSTPEALARATAYVSGDNSCAPLADADACAAFPCTNGAGVASCEDLAAPGALLNRAGRTCSCGDGFTYKNDTAGCVGKLSVAAFHAGHTVVMPALQAWALANSRAPMLTDVDACVAQPCKNGNGTAFCEDLPAPAADDPDGRNCSCSTGFMYVDDDTGCTGKQAQAVDSRPTSLHLAMTHSSTADVDACEATPCTDGDDTAVCVDKRAPALDDARGRTCSCLTPGFVYADETQGCVGK
jgi:hypothetical protein